MFLVLPSRQAVAVKKKPDAPLGANGGSRSCFDQFEELVSDSRLTGPRGARGRVSVPHRHAMAPTPTTCYLPHPSHHASRERTLPRSPS